MMDMENAFQDEEQIYFGPLSLHREDLRYMAQQHVPLKIMAKRCGKGDSGISDFLKKEHIPVLNNRQYIDTYREEVLEWFEAGENPEVIGAWLGVTEAALSYLKPRSAPRPPLVETLDPHYDYIVAEVAKGRTQTSLANELHVAQTSMSKYCTLKGIGAAVDSTTEIHKHLERYREEIRLMWEEGRGAKEIAGWIGVSRTAIYNCLTEMDLREPDSPIFVYLDSQRSVVLGLIAQGWKNVDIAAHVQVSSSMFTNWLRVRKIWRRNRKTAA